MNYGFKAMLEAIEKTGEQRTASTYPSEFPETCDKSCPHTQCSSWGIPEMQGERCRNIVPKNEDAPLSNALARIPLEQQIERILEKAFKPLEHRLREIERQANITRIPKFNGQQKRLRVDACMNQSRIGD